MTASGTQLKSCREEEELGVVADGPFHPITPGRVRVNMTPLDALLAISLPSPLLHLEPT